MHAVARVHVTVVVLALHQVLRDRRRCCTVAQRLRAHVLDDQLAVVVRTAARVLICPKKKNNQLQSLPGYRWQTICRYERVLRFTCGVRIFIEIDSRTLSTSSYNSKILVLNQIFYSDNKVYTESLEIQNLRISGH